jgi:hypothetical protein
MGPSARIKSLDEVVATLSRMQWESVSAILRQFGVSPIRKWRKDHHRESLLPVLEPVSDDILLAIQAHLRTTNASAQEPVEIMESLSRFRADFPDPQGVAFVMMRFGRSPAHAAIVSAIDQGLAPFGIRAVTVGGGS